MEKLIKEKKLIELFLDLGISYKMGSLSTD